MSKKLSVPVKDLRISAMILFCFFSIISVSQEFCHTAELQNAWFEKHPELRKKFFEERQKLQTNSNEQQRPAVATAIYTIPVVFHILHTGGVENISDAQVQDAVSIMTRDFNKLNADTANVVAQFKNRIGNTRVEFQLATRDPQGNCTNGIIRHWDSNTHAWSGNFGDYVYSWPSNEYLNIYVVRTITFPAAAYTYLPGSGVPAAVDAIVSMSSYVGSIGTSNVGTSRVLTHETGHWLGLEHVWGWNSVGTTCGDDGINDTPLTKGYTACSLSNAIICTPGVTENVQNYMDYSYCSKMFTTDQSNWMQSTMASPFFGRDFLSDPANLLQTGITNPGTGCQPFLDISVSPGATVCTGGTVALNSYTWNAVPTSYQWTSTGGALISNANSQNASAVFPATGFYTVTCFVSNSSGSDTKSLVLFARSSIPDITANASENFDNPNNIMPANWQIINPTTPNEKWILAQQEGVGGSSAMLVPGESLQPGSLEMLESPSYDFKNNPGATFSFKYAYAKQSSIHTDLFKVQATKNCGGNWSDIWVPGMSGLAQGSGGITGVLFHPTTNQWKSYEITQHPNFSPFVNQENVRFRFYFKEDSISGFGNRFYLDDVNFFRPTGLSESFLNAEISVYPNPAEDLLHLRLKSNNDGLFGVKLIDPAGKLLWQYTQSQAGEIDTAIDIDELAPGIYFISFESDSGKLVRKISVQ